MRVIENIRRTGLHDDSDVAKFIHWLNDPVIGTKVNCQTPGHVSPFSFVSDALLERARDYVVWANRGGSKSYLAGLVTWAKSSFIPQNETMILGGSFEQSEKSYKAMGDFWAISGLQEAYLVGEPSRRGTEWKNGSTVSVLTASTKSTRGPHPVHLVMDEIDEMESEVYDAALSMPQSKHGILSTIGKLSTNHRMDGIMDQAINMASQSGTRLYKWCIWECLEPCLDYSCSTCQLSRFCPGEHMKKADGYYKIHDFIQKLSALNMMTLQVEWFCQKAGRSDLVYGDQYDESLHAPSHLPFFSEMRPAYLSIDWGGEVFSIGVWQMFDIGWVRVAELYRTGTTNARLLEEAKVQPWWKNVQAAVADPARDDLIREWKDAGIPIISANNSVDVGIEAVRNALRPVIGRPKFFVNPKACPDWLREISGYWQKSGRPVKGKDHAMDETRYFVMWMIAAKPKRKGQVFPSHATAPVSVKTTPEKEGIEKQGAVVQNEAVQPGSEAKEVSPNPVPAAIEPKGVFHVQRKGRVFK